MNQFEKSADKIEKTAYSPDPFCSTTPVVYSHHYTGIKRSAGYANETSFLGVQNIADKRGQYNTMARIHAKVSYQFPSGKRIEESCSFDLTDEAIDEIIAELTKHRSK